MRNSTTTGWRVLAAHLTDLGLQSYICGFLLAFFCPNIPGMKILTFLAGLTVSLIISGVIVAIWGITPSEWLWGCKFNASASHESKFIPYIQCRLHLNDLEFTDYKDSFIKTIIGFILLAAIIVIYVL